uniref:Uncharacterized protein n=1 Tax=Anguilla anguilla TaxID=7936 RepID=A0A0E9UGU1_ANGAN
MVNMSNIEVLYVCSQC